MSMKLSTLKVTSLLTVLCLSASLTVTSCGKKDKVETAETPAKTEAPAAGTAPAPGAKTEAPAAGAGGALSDAEKKQLTPVRGALTMTNMAVKAGDMAKAKTQFDKFSGLWTTVEPIVKAKAGASYPAIESGIKMVTTAMGAGDKAKAGEGLGMAMKALDAVMNKK
jgi:ribosomal protein S20